MNWAQITPIDEELIENMRGCEAVFMNMISRYAHSEEIPYEERKRRYFAHLQYWNHILATERIDLLLLNHVPHMAWDYVMYELCRHRGVRTLFLERCDIINAFIMPSDWETAGKELLEKYQILYAQFEGEEHIPLSRQYELFYEDQTVRNVPPAGALLNPQLLQKNFLFRWCKKALKVFFTRPYKFFRSVLSPVFWIRKWNQHATLRYYDAVSEDPHLNTKYIYLPLHVQPEASTCPMSGAYTDQERMVELIAWHLPPDMQLYVKEHPSQGELFRSVEWYRRLQNIPAVKLIAKHVDSYQLMNNAIALATGTGSAAYEALFRGKPVLLFGHRFFQYAPGVFRIRTTADCKAAVQKVCEGDCGPSDREMRLFLKAIEEIACETYLGPLSERLSYALEEKIAIMGDYIAKKIRELSLL
ncbi:MAG: hypothetical protein WCX29_04065 [Candidatus Peribacteraceae bacterium]